MDRRKWEYKKLGEVCTMYQPKTISTQELVDAGAYLVYGANGVIGKYDKYNHEQSEILMTCRGATCGTINISEPFSWINGNAMVIHPTNNDYVRDFLVYQLKAVDKSSVITGAAQPQITRQMLQTLPVVLAPIEDQQRIVAELDCLNEMIAVKQEQLMEFDKLAQSIFYDMFGDPMENSHGWKSEILANIVSEDCSISYGIVQPGEDVEDGVPVVRPVDLTSTIVYRNGLKVVDKAISDSYRRTILKGNEILFCVRGTTGIMSFASEELKGCNVTRGITPLSFSEKVDKTYIYYLLMTPYLQSIIAEKTNGIALKQINMRDVRLLPILLPPLSLQQQFADKISAIEAQKELVKQSIAETQALFDYTMDYYFNE